MNYKLAMIPLLLAGMFASCNDTEELIQTNPEFVEAGYGALTLNLKYPDAKTKAVGDTLIGVAYDTEKTIKSVAFFVNTEAETINGTEMYGNFGGYFSDEDLLSANGLQEDLEEVAAGVPGEYTAKIRHRSDGWQNPQVMVIANYVENGLSAKLKEVKNWEELKTVVSATLSANPQTPLLMYSAKTIEAWKRTGDSNGGGSTSADFDMERLVSRIDIHNNAYNKTNPEQGFVLTSAQLIRPKTTSYLIPGVAASSSLEVSSVPFAISGTVVEEGTDPNVIQKIDSLYAYENANTDETTTTAVQVNGTFRGGRVSKVIAFKKVDGVDKTGDPIALARNHRYVVNLNAAPDSTDITWNIIVKEWNESDTIKVKPVYDKPNVDEALKTAVFDAGTSGISWTSGKVIDITNATSGDATLKFSISGTTASIVKTAYGYDKDGSSVGSLATDAIVKTDKPIVSYNAAKVETPITITFPKQNDEERVPLDIYVIIQNGGNLNACDTITIKSRPVYNGVANAQPVLMKDGKYWAPINVGAATTKNKAVTTANTDITADAGKLFQWGRLYGFAATNDATTCANDTTGIEMLGRPVQGDLTNMTKWDGKFIYSNTILQYNWLQINGEGNANPGNDGMKKGEWYQQLWNANEGIADVEVVKTATDPCPKGWRVPTQAEWIAIGAGQSSVSGTTWDSSNLRLAITGKESGKSLFLPAAGIRYGGNGGSDLQGKNGYYWSSSVQSNSTYAFFVNLSSTGKLDANTNRRADGYSVRCIQE